MSVARLSIVAAALILLAGPLARAQDAGTRIAVCNPQKVFDKMQEKKVIQDRLNSEREKMRAEAGRRQNDIKAKIQQRNELKAGSSLYESKSNEIMQDTVQYEVWARLTEANMARQEKDQIMALYEKIRSACEEVAKERKIDLVLTERRPEISPEDREKLNSKQLGEVMGQNNVLFVAPAADITDAVVLILYRKFNQAGAAPAPGN
jgi:Skp family chaperone for outer membrane proteins